MFSGSLRDNLNLSQLENDDQRLRQALDFAGLGPFINGHPKGLHRSIAMADRACQAVSGNLSDGHVCGCKIPRCACWMNQLPRLTRRWNH